MSRTLTVFPRKIYSFSEDGASLLVASGVNKFKETRSFGKVLSDSVPRLDTVARWKNSVVPNKIQMAKRHLISIFPNN